MSKKRSAIDKAYDSMLAKAFDPNGQAKAKAELKQIKQKLKAGQKGIDRMHSDSIDDVHKRMAKLSIVETTDDKGVRKLSGSASEIAIYRAYEQHLAAMQARNEK